MLLCPWDFPGKSAGVDCHFLLQGIFPTQETNPGLLHWRQTLYCLSHQESPLLYIILLIKKKKKIQFKLLLHAVLHILFVDIVDQYKYATNFLYFIVPFIFPITSFEQLSSTIDTVDLSLLLETHFGC